MQDRKRITKNVLANLARGGAAGLAALILPAFLVRHMREAEYAVWVLILQISAYASYLNFGLQTAVGRYVAFANEKKDAKQRDSVFSTAMFGLTIAGAVALIALIGIAMLADRLFPSMPQQLIAQMKLALLIVGGSIALGLPASAWEGLFIGLQRYEIPALVTGGSRLLSALGLIIAARAGASIIFMATILAGVNVMSYVVAYLLARKTAPEVRFQRALIQRSTVHELGRYCFSLSVWSFSTLLVSGLDLILVGRFQFRELAAYGVAAGLVAFVAGAQSAIFGVIMPQAAIIHARQDSVRLGRLVVTTTRLGVLLLIVTGMPLLVYANSLMRMWVGSAYALQGYKLLEILLIANMIRLVGVPYAVILIGSGQQKQVLVSPLAEGITNLAASLILGYRFGAIGVAIGTLIGACVSVAAHLLYSMPRTFEEIRFTRSKILFSGVLNPAIWTFPALVIAIASIAGRVIQPAIMIVGALTTMAGVVIVLYKSGIRPSIRSRLPETKTR